MLLWPLTCSFSRTLFFSPKKRAALLSAAAFHLTGWFCLVSLWLSFLSADPWLITAEVELLHFSSNWKRENIYRESYSSLSRENEIWKGEKDASAWLFWIRTTTNSPFWPLSCFLVHLLVVYWTSLAAFIQNINCFIHCRIECDGSMGLQMLQQCVDQTCSCVRMRWVCVHTTGGRGHVLINSLSIVDSLDIHV